MIVILLYASMRIYYIAYSSVCMYFTKYDFCLVYIITESDDLSSDEQDDWGVEQSVASGESSKFI